MGKSCCHRVSRRSGVQGIGSVEGQSKQKGCWKLSSSLDVVRKAMAGPTSERTAEVKYYACIEYLV